MAMKILIDPRTGKAWSYESAFPDSVKQADKFRKHHGPSVKEHDYGGPVTEYKPETK